MPQSKQPGHPHYSIYVCETAYNGLQTGSAAQTKRAASTAVCAHQAFEEWSVYVQYWTSTNHSPQAGMLTQPTLMQPGVHNVVVLVDPIHP